MARIVPAKPKKKNEFLKSAVTKVEVSLGDEWLVLQNTPKKGDLLLLKEGVVPVVIMTVADVASVSDVAKLIVQASGDYLDLNKEAARRLTALGDAGLKDARFHILVSGGDDVIETSIGLENMISPTLITRNVEEVLEIADRHADADLSVSIINSVLGYFYEGATRFIPGEITEHQMKWRHESRPSPDDLRPEAQGRVSRPVTLPAKVETFELNRYSSIRVGYLQDLIETCFNQIADGASIYSSGVEIDASFVSDADALLPALLIAASEEWTPVVVKSKGYGGFDIRLTKDKESLVGFRVVDTLVSTPSMLFLPISHLLSNCFDGEDFVVDEIVQRFVRWVEKYDLEADVLEGLDVKIALKAIEA